MEDFVPPQLELLIQMVAPSPIIRKILQWNGRLVCIGTNVVRIFQYASGGNLSHTRTIHLRSDIRNAVVAWRSIILAMATGEVHSITDDGVTNSRLGWYKELDNPYSGASMVTDPAQRYLAITSTENSVLLLHQPKQANMLIVRGIIIEMCFLYPEQQDPHHVALLLLVAHKGEIRAVLYEWDADGPLSAMNCSHEYGVAIDRAVAGKIAPLLLIPLEDPRHYAIFFDGGGAAIFKSGNLPLELVRTLDNMDVEPPRVGYKGKYNPLWTAWSKLPEIGLIFVGREDGHVATIKSFSGEAISYGGVVVNLKCNIEGAFACVSVNPEGSSDDAHQLLFVGGVTGPGHVYQIKKGSFSQLSILPNWAPVCDISSTPASEGQTKTIPAKLIVRCGRDAESFNAELIRSIKADVSLRLKVGSQVNGIWAIEGLHHDQSHYDKFTPCILISLLDSTIMLRAEKDTDKFELATEDDTWFDLSSRTLAASLGGPVSVQVTEREVRMSSRTNRQLIHPHDEVAVTRKLAVEVEPSPQCAFVYDSQFVLLAFADTQGGSVSVFKLGDDLTGDPLQASRLCDLSYRKCPQSVSVLSFGGFDYLVVSDTVEGPLDEKMVPSEQLTFTVLPKTRDDEFIKPINAELEYIPPQTSTSALGNLASGTSQQRGAFISATILTRPGETSGLLIAGHQHGFLSYVIINPADSAQINIGKDWQSRRLGYTDVKICPDPGNCSAALVFCEDGLWLITLGAHGPHLTKVNWDGEGGDIQAITPFGNRFLLSAGEEVVALRLGEDSTGSVAATIRQQDLILNSDLNCKIETLVKQPVYAAARIPQIPSHLVACAGQQLFLLSKTLHLRTRFNIDLPSRGVGICIANGCVNVVTARHSILSFTLDLTAGRLLPIFRDPLPRSALSQFAFEHENWNVVLVSDSSRSVTGLAYCPASSDSSISSAAPKDMKTLFEAGIPSSIIKFQLVSCRPSWDATRLTGDGISSRGLPRWGNAAHGEELLGVSIDGAVYHFTLLQGPLLELVLLLRKFRDEVDKVDYPSDVGVCGTFGSVDSEVVKKWLDGHELYQFLVERMVATDDEVQSHAGEFVDTVRKWQSHDQSSDGLNLSGWSLDNVVTKETLESCVEDVYKVLQFLFRPVV